MSLLDGALDFIDTVWRKIIDTPKTLKKASDTLAECIKQSEYEAQEEYKNFPYNEINSLLERGVPIDKAISIVNEVLKKSNNNTFTEITKEDYYKKYPNEREIVLPTYNYSIQGKPFYFLYYYVPKNAKNLLKIQTRETKNISLDILQFKNGLNQLSFINKIITIIPECFEKLTLVCIPASTIRENNIRYKNFSKKLCEELNMINGFDHIHITKEKTLAFHKGGKEIADYDFDQNFFYGKHIALFDDIVTSEKSMRYFINKLESFGATVEYCFSLGRTYNDYENRKYPNAKHPFTDTFVTIYGN